VADALALDAAAITDLARGEASDGSLAQALRDSDDPELGRTPTGRTAIRLAAVIWILINAWVAAIGAFVVIAVASVYEIRRPSPPRGSASKAREWEGGYLSPSAVPDIGKLISPPPTSGSPEMARDEEARAAAIALKGTPRYRLAMADAGRSTDETAQAFSCALGTDINGANTPRLYKMMMRMRIDIRTSTYGAKQKYSRPQPFAVDGTETCSPKNDALARGEGSYPNARAAVGAAYGQLLAELNPARADIILTRAQEFRHSRVICDAAWQSDVDAGRDVGTAMLARLKGNSMFRADMEAARTEVARAIATGHKPSSNCSAESIALAAR